MGWPWGAGRHLRIKQLIWHGARLGWEVEEADCPWRNVHSTAAYYSFLYLPTLDTESEFLPSVESQSRGQRRLQSLFSHDL